MMPTNKHCELVNNLAGDLSCSKLGRLRSSSPGPFLGSYVASRVLSTRLVQ